MDPVVAETLEVNRLRDQVGKLAALLAPFLTNPMLGYSRGDPCCIFCGSSDGHYTRWYATNNPHLDSWEWRHHGGCPTQDAELLALLGRTPEGAR